MRLSSSSNSLSQRWPLEYPGVPRAGTAAGFVKWCMGSKIVRRGCAGILLGLLWAMSWAQDLLPPPAERVQRQADNPLRWIIEAGKLKSRPKPVAEPEAAARASGDKPAPRNAQAKAPAHPKEAVVASAAVATAASNPTAGPASREAGRDEAPPPPPAALQLVSEESWVLPGSIYAGLREVAELQLQFTVNPDGSVSEVSVQASNNPTVDPSALATVRGWRFKPIAQAQVHSVQLVFHPRP